MMRVTETIVGELTIAEDDYTSGRCQVSRIKGLLLQHGAIVPEVPK